MSKPFFILSLLIVVFWSILAYLSLGNYQANQLVQDDEFDSNNISFSPLYSDALYFAAVKYALSDGDGDEFNPVVEGLYSEVAASRPLSPSPWISLANWATENNFFENSEVYLSTALLLLRNKPAAAFDLFELTEILGDRDLSISIAAGYLQQYPKEFSSIIEQLSEDKVLDDEYINDVVLSSFSQQSIKGASKLISNYILSSLANNDEIVKYLYDFLEVNQLELNKYAATRLNNYFLKNEHYDYLRRANEYFSRTIDNLFSISEANINMKGSLCWTLPQKTELFKWQFLKEGAIEIKFDGTENLSFSHLSCGFFLPNRQKNSITNELVNINFKLVGDEITTKSGIYAEIYQPKNGRLAVSKKMTGSWNKQIEMAFLAVDREKPFYFRLRRNKTRDLDNLLSGKFSISNFSVSTTGHP